jgi:subtilisin family serine protease
MRLLWSILVLCALYSTQIYSDPVRIAVVDTGVSMSDPRIFPHLCVDGHKDFTGMGIEDVNGHGTHVAGLIIKYAKDANYCLVILKYYHTEFIPENSSDASFNAFAYATTNNIKVLNFSGGGKLSMNYERILMNNNKQITFIVAAGNEGNDLAKVPYYPASYNLSNEIIVGGTGKIYKHNYGKIVKVNEESDYVLSFWLNNEWARISGTSMSTAIHTGKYIYENYK